MRVRGLILGVCLAAGLTGGVQAQDKPLTAPLSAAAVQQLALADQLVAIGVARKDPLLLIAAVRIRTGLTPEAADFQEDLKANEDILAKAKEFSEGREDFADLIKDVEAEGSRGYYSGGSYCYTAGSATICN